MKFRITSISVVLLVVFLLMACAKEKTGQTEKIQQDKQTAIVTVPKQCTEGMITIYAEDEGRIFQYSGSIMIKNAGWNGRPIEIVAYIEEDGYAEDSYE